MNVKIKIITSLISKHEDELNLWLATASTIKIKHINSIYTDDMHITTLIFYTEYSKDFIFNG